MQKILLIMAFLGLVTLTGCDQATPKKTATPREMLKRYTDRDIDPVANTFQGEEQNTKCWIRFRCRESVTDVYLQQINVIEREDWEYDEKTPPPDWLEGPDWWKQEFRAEQKYAVGMGEVNGYRVTAILDQSLVDIWVVSLLFES